MAFDTKPNLSNAKFEQFAGETLTLSGRTEIHGIIEVENTGIFRLDDTNQQQGYVLTSNADGCGNWVAPSITGASNGLTQSGQYVTLGGPLTGSSNVSLETNSFGFVGCDGQGELSFGRYYQGETATQDLSTFKGSAKDGILLNNTNSGGTIYSQICLFDQDSFILQSKGAVLETSICYQEGITNALRITDSKNSKGMVYADDYSTSGITDPRWIPDYAAVTAATQSLTVGGVDTNIQYNDSDLLGGSNSFTWNDTTKVLNVAGSISISGTSFLRAGDNTSAIELGQGSNTSANNTIAIGTLAAVTQTNATAIGACVSATAAGAIILGYNTGGIIPNNVADSMDVTFNQPIPTLHIACQGVSYLVGETDAYPVMGFGTVSPTARVHIVATGATEGFRLQDGTQADTYVMVSDASGNASWSNVINTLVSCTDFNTYTGNTDTRITNIETDVNTIQTTFISGATNGLGVTGQNVCLGGTILNDTCINMNDFGIAWGGDSVATGVNAIAGGYCAEATGADYASFAWGYYACATGGYGAAAFGCDAKATGDASFAANCGEASGFEAFAAGTSHAVGARAFAANNTSFAFGSSSFAFGQRALACKDFSFAGGNSYSIGGKCIVADGETSFIFSTNTAAQIAGHGALANNSSILGGINHNIESGNTGAAIIGGDGIKLTGTSYIDTTAVDKLALITTLSNNTSTDEVLVRNPSTGLVDYVSKASLQTEVNPNKVVDVIEQNGHGFSVGEVIGWAGGLYTKAIADGTYTGEIIGVVYEVIGVDDFKLAQSGWLTGFTGLVPNQTYWLSTTVSGGLQTTEPTVDGEVSRPIMVAQSSTEAIIFPYRGQIITSGDTPSPPNATVEGFDIVGDDSSTGFTIIHNYGTRDVIVSVTEAQTPWSVILVDTRLTSTNSVDVLFDVAPATGEDYRVVITH